MRRDLEWLNQNAGRNYPLMEDATGVFASYPPGGPTSLPTDLVVDLKFMAPVGATTFPYYLGCVSYTGVLFSVLITDATGSPMAGSTINLSTIEKYADLELDSLSDGVTGVITFGEGIGNVQDSFVPGKYILGSTGGLLESSVAIPYHPANVLSLQDAKEEEDNSSRLVGDVKFIPGNNMRIDRDPVTNSLVFSLLEVETFTPVCEQGCIKGTCANAAITRLAGIAPDPVTGRISIRGENGVRITIEDGKIVIGHDLRLADLCDRYDRAPDGDMGRIGTEGLIGRRGVCICGECDVPETGFSPIPSPPSPCGVMDV